MGKEEKRKRARLYYDTGLDTLNTIAKWNHEEIRKILADFIECTNFDGSIPTLGEAASSVKMVKNLRRILESRKVKIRIESIEK